MEKGDLEFRRAAMIKPRKIERSGFFYWTTTDKLEFTDWSEVPEKSKFSDRGGLKGPPPIPERVKWTNALILECENNQRIIVELTKFVQSIY